MFVSPSPLCTRYFSSICMLILLLNQQNQHTGLYWATNIMDVYGPWLSITYLRDWTLTSLWIQSRIVLSLFWTTTSWNQSNEAFGTWLNSQGFDEACVIVCKCLLAFWLVCVGGFDSVHCDFIILYNPFSSTGLLCVYIYIHTHLTRNKSMKFCVLISPSSLDWLRVM